MSSLAHAHDWYVEARHRAFRLRDELIWEERAALALAMAFLTGAVAQVRVPLPYTPVPITGQVFAVLLSGALLGAGHGGLSQVFYVGLGAMGMPWFAGLSGGMAALFGPSGGYIIGFIPAALLIGRVTEKWPPARRFLPLCALMLLGVGIIYLFGALQFSFVMHAGLKSTFALAVVPFIGVDLLKATLAASLSAAILPKTK
jgi:biotin transport system substrate-specific component